MRKSIIYLFLIGCLASCDLDKQVKLAPVNKAVPSQKESVSLIVLGNVQDAGSPHIGCKKECCASLFENRDHDRRVVSLGVIDHKQNQKFVFEASPDFHLQVKDLKNLSDSNRELPDGIFLTHAHIGHYTGLMYLGKEAVNADQIPVYAMPRMKTFLESNGPWSQLVDFKNISIHPLEDNQSLKITEQLEVIPFKVPHRDEFSETVGYRIKGPSKTALFIPDIDKWEKWEEDIIAMIKTVDIAFLDATFYDAAEINYRDISEIPHPFVVESIDKFSHLSAKDKSKLHFIHLNHTNPLLDRSSEATKNVLDKGFNVARKGMSFEL